MTRSSVEGLQKDSSSFDGDALIACSGGNPDYSDSQRQTLEGPCHVKERDSLQDPVSGMSPNQGQEADSYFCSGSVGYEGALQHQEQLIGRFAAEEKSQKEWEAKFKGNNSFAPDSCDPGDHSDVTEEGDDVKTTGQLCVVAANAPGKDSKLDGANKCFFSSKEAETLKRVSSLSEVDIGVQERERSSRITHETLAPDIGFSLSRGTGHQVQPENHDQTSHGHTHFAASSHMESLDNNSLSSISPDKGCQVNPVLRDTTDSVGSVLEALEKAKLSLKQKVDGLQLLESKYPSTDTESFISGTRTPDKVEVPAGCPGLFRLPIDIPNTNSVGSTASRLSLASNFPTYAGDKSYYSPYLEPKSSVSGSGQCRTISTSSAESITRACMKSAYKPAAVAGLPSSTRFTHTDLQGSSSLTFTSKLMYPSYPFYQDVTAQLPISGGSRINLDNRDVGLYSASSLSPNNGLNISLPCQNSFSINDD